MNPLDFLTAIGSLVMTSKALIESWINLKDRKDRENDIMVKDLCDLLDELRKTLAFCVKLVSPLRHMSDNPQTFANDFKNVYNDFRDNYDMYDFVNERMSCSTIDHIRSRIEKRKPHFGSLEQWEQLYKCIDELGFVDYKIIDLHYKPFLIRYNNVMNAIEQRVEKNQIAEAIAEKNAFLKSLDPQFQQIKVTLENMAELVGKTTTRLQNYDL